MNSKLLKRACASTLFTAAAAVAVSAALSTQSRPAIADSCQPSLVETAVAKLTPEELNALLSTPFAVTDGLLEELGEARSQGYTGYREYPSERHVYITFREMMEELMRPAMFLGPDGREYSTWNGFIGSIGQNGIGTDDWFFCQ